MISKEGVSRGNRGGDYNIVGARSGEGVGSRLYPMVT
jgi:hypothetical protein